jgi:hypothetical protein
MVVPEVVLGRRDGQAWLTTFGTPPRLSSPQPIAPPDLLRYAHGEASVTAYRAAVAEAVRRIVAGRVTTADVVGRGDYRHLDHRSLRGKVTVPGQAVFEPVFEIKGKRIAARRALITHCPTVVVGDCPPVGKIAIQGRSRHTTLEPKEAVLGCLRRSTGLRKRGVSWSYSSSFTSSNSSLSSDALHIGPALSGI